MKPSEEHEKDVIKSGQPEYHFTKRDQSKGGSRTKYNALTTGKQAKKLMAVLSPEQKALCKITDSKEALAEIQSALGKMKAILALEFVDAEVKFDQCAKYTIILAQLFGMQGKMKGDEFSDILVKAYSHRQEGVPVAERIRQKQTELKELYALEEQEIKARGDNGNIHHSQG